MHSFTIKSNKRCEIINITDKVEEIIRKSKIQEGLCVVYTPHATAAITINENWDPSVCDDFLDLLEKLIPKGIWKHDKIDSNGDAHLKSSLIGPSESLIIKDNKLVLGKWQSIAYCEFDGPRKREVNVKIIKD